MGEDLWDIETIQLGLIAPELVAVPSKLKIAKSAKTTR
jgi:hypothetical protein